jgi:hypothetical protein
LSVILAPGPGLKFPGATVAQFEDFFHDAPRRVENDVAKMRYHYYDTRDILSKSTMHSPSLGGTARRLLRRSSEVDFIFFADPIPFRFKTGYMGINLIKQRIKSHAAQEVERGDSDKIIIFTNNYWATTV